MVSEATSHPSVIHDISARYLGGGASARAPATSPDEVRPRDRDLPVLRVRRRVWV
jgi:hypothetical protein